MPARKTAKALKETRTAPPDTLAFEQAFQELEEIVQQLEHADLALEDALTLFERGQALAAHCGKQLDNAELKLQQVQAGGELTPLQVDNER